MKRYTSRMTQPGYDESPEGVEEQCRELLREKRDRRMFQIRFDAYMERMSTYEEARSRGEMPLDFTPEQG